MSVFGSDDNNNNDADASNNQKDNDNDDTQQQVQDGKTKSLVDPLWFQDIPVTRFRHVCIYSAQFKLRNVWCTSLTKQAK